MARPRTRARAGRRAQQRAEPTLPRAEPQVELRTTRARPWFLIKALALMALFSIAYYFPYAPESGVARAIAFYLRLQAAGSSVLIGLFDPNVAVSGTVISGRFPVEIVKSCSSLDAQALYAAAVLAFPARVVEKVWGVVLGLVLLGSLNLARIASLYFVGAHAPGSFDTLHEEILPLVLVSAACLAFLGWLSSTRQVRTADAA